ncbi:MAG: hypothetical protein NTZ75_08025 [Euryarchaeota archaeon]|jgi:hypothetical protein|nr:hypothetical protein [Thermoplasmata archaeon]MCX6664180.1 hypothetical protein [Euryarchaeota archaeon]
MNDEITDPEEVSCMALTTKKVITSNEELMLFMHRFNLDWDTVETMPAFEEHCKVLFRREETDK